MKLVIQFLILIVFFIQSAVAAPNSTAPRKTINQFVISQVQSNNVVENFERWAKQEGSAEDFKFFQTQKPGLVKFAKIIQQMKITEGQDSLIFKADGAQPFEISWKKESQGLMLINGKPINVAQYGSFQSLFAEVSKIMNPKQASVYHLFVPEAEAFSWLLIGALVVVGSILAIKMFSNSGAKQLNNLREKFSGVLTACENPDDRKKPFSDSQTAQLFTELNQNEKLKDLFQGARDANKKLGESCVTYFTSGSRLGHPELIKQTCDQMQKMLVCVKQFQDESIKKHGADSVSEESVKAVQ